MSVTYVGTKTVASACLSIGLALPGLSASLADVLAKIAQLEARLAANLNFLLTPPAPPELALSISLAASGALAAIGSLSLSLPSAVLSANLSIEADIALLLSFRDLLQGIVATFSAAASAGGLHVLAVDSTPATVGGELGAVVAGGMPAGGGPAARIRGVVLLTEDPATHVVLSTVLAT